MKDETSSAGGPHAGKMDAIRRRAVHEARSFLTLFIYLLVLFSLFVLNEAVVTRQHGGSIALQGFALVNAFILAKVMLVIESLELARWLKGRPAILVILYEAALCTILFLCFHVLERVVVSHLRGVSETSGDLAVGGGGFFGVVIVALILFVSLLPFFAFKNVAAAIGMDRMRQILFRRATPEP